MERTKQQIIRNFFSSLALFLGSITALITTIAFFNTESSSSLETDPPATLAFEEPTPTDGVGSEYEAESTPSSQLESNQVESSTSTIKANLTTSTAFIQDTSTSSLNDQTTLESASVDPTTTSTAPKTTPSTTGTTAPSTTQKPAETSTIPTVESTQDTVTEANEDSSSTTN